MSEFKEIAPQEIAENPFKLMSLLRKTVILQ